MQSGPRLRSRCCPLVVHAGLPRSWYQVPPQRAAFSASLLRPAAA